MTRLSIVFLLTMFFIACGGDDVQDCNSSTFMTAVSDEIELVNQAAAAFGVDPSQANCDAFKSAAQNYLNAVEGFSNCDGLTQAEFDQALSAARQSIDAIPC